MNHGAPIYLDHNASTPVAAEAVSAMIATLGECYGNPSSMHSIGQAAKSVLANARRAVAQLVGAGPAEIVFTSGATESNHLAVLGALAMQPGKRHLVLSEVEHPSLIALARQLERRGIETSWIPVDRGGRIDPHGVASAIRPDTALVSAMCSFISWTSAVSDEISPASIPAKSRSRRHAPSSPA